MDSRDALLHAKNARVLVSLKTVDKKWYASNLAKEAGLSFVHTCELLGILAKDGLIEAKKEGRIKRVVLTENGVKVANSLEELLVKMNALVSPPKPQKVEPAPPADEKKESAKLG